MDYAICGIAILIIVLLIILLLIFIALPLYLTARFLDEDEGLPKALGTTILLIISFAILSSLGWIGFIIAIIVNLFIIKAVYETSWGKALVMWIVTIIMAVVIAVIVIVLVGLSIWALMGV
ncbi:MAG: hypothetical protein JSV56_12280 [Methanomassiliicoccales archaeon]|nr:MAG: hypothetical protein JSV56_12280 [Methanomassiliicoccales archaeon]